MKCQDCGGAGTKAIFRGCPLEGITVFSSGDHCPYCGVPQGTDDHDMIPEEPPEATCSWCGGTGEEPSGRKQFV